MWERKKGGRDESVYRGVGGRDEYKYLFWMWKYMFGCELFCVFRCFGGLQNQTV